MNVAGENPAKVDSFRETPVAVTVSDGTEPQSAFAMVVLREMRRVVAVSVRTGVAVSSETVRVPIYFAVTLFTHYTTLPLYAVEVPVVDEPFMPKKVVVVFVRVTVV